MEKENTIGERMADNDPELYDFVKIIMDKPGAFVGSNHFDYVEYLLEGYTWRRKPFISWYRDAELQYWLLHSQSASLHSGEMRGLSLFYRCFGSRDTAFNEFKNFLKAAAPENPMFVYQEIYDFEEKNDTVQYGYTPIPEGHYQKLAKSVFDIIRDMINKSGFSCDKLKIYIRRESLFTQVRFLFHSENGWIDDEKIIAVHDNHELLIALHANARNAKAINLKKHGCDVFDAKEVDNSFSFTKKNNITHGLGRIVSDKISFSSEFLRWKEKIISG